MSTKKTKPDNVVQINSEPIEATATATAFGANQPIVAFTPTSTTRMSDVERICESRESELRRTIRRLEDALDIQRDNTRRMKSEIKFLATSVSVSLTFNALFAIGIIIVSKVAGLW